MMVLKWRMSTINMRIVRDAYSHLFSFVQSAAKLGLSFVMMGSIARTAALSYELDSTLVKGEGIRD